ncbi:rRNA maturation RNase YbeY [Clostridium sp. LY3-2]|uniref:rRNA maturation RNase YbeY n=1 Tax=Clostridium sp. LY3-2 TaxID=2942482 RepID=UPI00215347DB|nr:rRNA maturation RNase YbeY [Clostridium sp. LY3-2]MCR6513491.1 rRNA maturation RNase YbeY [Clostridium sp. LY3-2]
MIYVENNQDKIEVSEDLIKKIKEVINFALKEEDVNIKTEISVLLVDNEEIREINNQTRNIDRATDVLSFPMLDFEDKKVYKEVYKDEKFDDSYFDGEDLVLGDMVLSLERAKEQSEEFNHSFEREVFYLIVHSVLHLLGYDHMEEDEKSIMRKREEEILGSLEIVR